MYFFWKTHLPLLFKIQALVAQKVDNAINAINVNNNYILWITIYVFHNLRTLLY